VNPSALLPPATLIRIHLPEAEADRLEQAFRQATDRKLRDRLQIILMADRGRPHQEIATDLAVSTRSVQRWLNAYFDGGLDALRPRKAPGRAPKIPDRLGPELRRWVLDGPAALGLDRANWTHAELADQLRKAHGISASESAVARFCRKQGIRTYRPTYRFLRGDPEKQAAAALELAGLKKKPRPAIWCC
jgi:transposase